MRFWISYLPGVCIVRSWTFKISLRTAKRSFYRAANSIFGQLDRTAEEVIIPVAKRKCIRALLCGLEVCPLKSDVRYDSYVLSWTDSLSNYSKLPISTQWRTVRQKYFTLLSYSKTETEKVIASWINHDQLQYLLIGPCNTELQFIMYRLLFWLKYLLCTRERTRNCR